MIAPGSIVPLSLQVDDGDNSKFVAVTIRNPQGDLLIEKLSMPSLGGGLYLTSTFRMPIATEFVTAIYQVYEDQGFTIPSNAFGLSSETFFSHESSSVLNDNNNDDVELTGYLSLDMPILPGHLSLDMPILTGKLEHLQLIGVLEEEDQNG